MTDSAEDLRCPPAVIGIGGCSGSGKTTLAMALARALGGTHFPIDHYYRDLAHLPPERRTQQNFDDPALIEIPLLAAHVAALARGERIERPVYDFSTHTRVPGRTDSIAACPYLLVEGIFALYYPELLPLYHLRVYLDAPDELCYARRLKRDMEERGRTAESVLRQYWASVRPASLRYVRPSQRNADLTLDGAAPVESNVRAVLAALRTRTGGKDFPF